MLILYLYSNIKSIQKKHQSIQTNYISLIKGGICMKKEFSLVVNSFIEAFENLLRDEESATDELTESKWYQHLAESMVLSPIFRDWISKLNRFTAGDNEDMVHEITIRIIQRTNTMIRAKSIYSKDMNYKSYISTIVSSYLTDINRKYIYKENTESLLSKRAYLVIESIFDPVYVNDDNGFSIIDSLKSEINNPEVCFVEKTKDLNSRYKVLDYFELVSKHKSKGEVLSVVLYGLKNSFMDTYNIKYPNSKMKYYDIIAQMFFEAGYDNFVRLYRDLMLRYNKEELQLSIDKIKPYLSYTIEDFGKIDYTSQKSIRDKIYKWNWLASQEIAEYKDREKKFDRNK